MSIKINLKQYLNRGSQRRNYFLILVLLLALAGFYPAKAAGSTYYVDKTNSSCSDTGTGQTPALPFCTITKGASAAAAGDTVQVLAGSYAETVTVPKSGSAGLPITYSAEAGVIVTGNGNTSSGGAFRITSRSYVTIDGFTVTGTADYGLYVWGSDHITLSNNHVSYSGQPLKGSTRVGIYLNSIADSTITGNTTDHNSQDGIRLASGAVNNTVSNNISFANAEQWQRNATGIQVYGSTSSNNTIIHNITYANEDSGMQNYSGAHNNILVGNLSYGNGDHGIDNLNSPNNIVVGNTVQGNHTAGINFEGTGTGSSGATIMNNISVDNGIAPITGQKSNIRVDASSIAGTTMDYNIVYLSGSGDSVIQWNGPNYATLAAFQAAVPGQEVHGIQADPLFVSPVAYATRPPVVVVGDFHIQVGSPVIDSANSDALSETSLDIQGLPRVDDPSTPDTGAGARTYDDRGAYEYQLTGISLPVVTTQAVTDILTTTATGNGSFTELGIPNPTEHGVVWSTAASPTIADYKTEQGAVTAAGAFTSSLTGLTPNTLYYVRAYATNAAGTAYGDEVTFNTALQTEYTLTINTIGSGTVTKNPDQATYHDGVVVTLTATPAANWNFTGWSGDASGTANPVMITINGNKNVTATFMQNEYTLTVTSAHGTVTKNPDQATYHNGDVVTLGMTTTEPGWTFTGWTPALTNNTVTISANTSVTANFTQNEYNLSIAISPSGSGTVTKNPDQVTYHYGDVVTLTATPAADWNFTGWSGDASGTANPVTITMNGNKNVTATFMQNEYTLSIAISPSGSGTVVISPNQTTYHYGDVVTLTATPAAGWHFVSWSANAAGGNVTILSNTSVTATFARDNLTISGSVGTAGAGASLSYTGGTSPVMADSTGLYSISVPYNWSGTVKPSKTGYTFTPTQKSYKNIKINQTLQNYTAQLAIPPIPITISPNGSTVSPLTFMWYKSTGLGNITYLLSVYNTRTRAYPINNYGITATCVGDTCSYTASLSAGSYSFSVAAVNESGSSGFGSTRNWRTFIVP